MIGPIASLAADLTVTFTAADRSEARLRSVPPVAVINPAVNPAAPAAPQRKTAIDLSTSPTAGLSFAWPNTEFSLGYAIGISKIDVQLDNPVLIFHSGRAAVSWWTRDLRLTLSEEGSYGHTSYVGLPPATQLGPPSSTAPMMISYVPQIYDIRVGSLRTVLSATWTIDARWTSGASVSYEVAGGLDAVSQLALPRRRTPAADVSLTYGDSANDELTTRVGASETFIESPGVRERDGGQFLVIAATETWGHRWSEQTRGSLGGGVTYLRSRPRTGYTFGYAVLPNAAANVSHSVPLDRGSTVTLSAGSSLGTGYNAVQGVVNYSATATAGAAWTDDPFAVTAGVAIGQSLRLHDVDPPSSRGLTASLGASYTPVALITFEIGGRTYWYFSDDTAVPSTPVQWVLFAAVTIRAPPLSF